MPWDRAPHTPYPISIVHDVGVVHRQLILEKIKKKKEDARKSAWLICTALI
jgi:hypothetical protein